MSAVRNVTGAFARQHVIQIEIEQPGEPDELFRFRIRGIGFPARYRLSRDFEQFGKTFLRVPLFLSCFGDYLAGGFFIRIFHTEILT